MSKMELAEKIITEARCQLGKKISDAVYISLADHISFSTKSDLMRDLILEISYFGIFKGFIQKNTI